MRAQSINRIAAAYVRMAMQPKVALTLRQVKSLMRKHGIPGEVGGRGSNWEVEVPDEKAMRQFEKVVGPTGGYRSGHGSWVLSPGYKPKGDWNDPSSAHHYASAVIVGDIFASAWGYDQTMVYFYQVVKVTPKMVQLRPIEKRVIRSSAGSDWVVPLANKFTGSAVRKKLGDYQGRAVIRMESYEFAYKWSGKEMRQTGGTGGH
jgi:hypothetical protein